MACDPNDLMADAKCLLCNLNGMESAIIISLLCQIRDNSGGGGSTTQVTEGNYAGGVPPFTPTNTTIAFDTSTGQQWNWWSGSWH